MPAAQPRVLLHLFRPGISQPVWCGHNFTSGLTTTNRQHDRRVKGRVMAEYASATDRDRRSLKLTIPQRQSQTAHVPSMHLAVRACSYGHATGDGRLEREASIKQNSVGSRYAAMRRQIPGKHAQYAWLYLRCKNDRIISVAYQSVRHLQDCL